MPTVEELRKFTGSTQKLFQVLLHVEISINEFLVEVRMSINLLAEISTCVFSFTITSR